MNPQSKWNKWRAREERKKECMISIRRRERGENERANEKNANQQYCLIIGRAMERNEREIRSTANIILFDLAIESHSKCYYFIEEHL